MKNPNIVVTNLRIPKDSWHDIKVRAAERNISVNAYINDVLHEAMTRIPLGLPFKRSRKKKRREDFFAAWEKLPKMKPEPFGELSEDDKIIYGLDD